MGYSVAAPGDLEGSPIDRAVYSALLIFGISILLSRKVKWRVLIKNNAWLFTLFLYMLVSIIWADFPGISFKRWTRSLADGVMALIVLTESEPLEAIYAVLRRVLCINIPLSIIFIKFYRDIGTDWDYLGNEMWIGVTTHKNVLGQVAMIAGIYFIVEIMRNWRTQGWRGRNVLIYSFFLLLTLWILNGSPSSRSTTSMILFIVGVLLLLGLNYLRPKIVYISKYFVFGVFLVGFLFLTIQAYTALTATSVTSAALEASGRDSTLTGRTDLWNDLLKIASESPILGVGYGSFWIGNSHGLWDIHIWAPTQGHNGYIDVYVELGAIGLFLIGGLIISSYRRILHEFKPNYDAAAIRLTLLTMIIFHNVSESSFLRGTVDLWFLFLLVVINVPRGSELQIVQKT